MTWLSSYLDPIQQTERIGFWCINVHDLLLSTFEQHKSQPEYAHCSNNLWHFYDANPQIVVTVTAPPPQDIGVPYFYVWSPLPTHKHLVKSLERAEWKPFVTSQTYPRLFPHHLIYVHKNLKYFGTLDFYNCFAAHEIDEFEQQHYHSISNPSPAYQGMKKCCF